MGYPEVKAFFEQKGLPYDIILFEQSTATVELAAQALGTDPDNIGKTLSFKLTDGTPIVVLVAGRGRIDNRKFKDQFHCKAKMLTPEEALTFTGHPVGGVCPFALPEGTQVYLDATLKRHEFIFPAAGTPQSAVRIPVSELAVVTGGEWVDLCKEYEAE